VSGKKQHEMSVVMKAKDLCRYVMTITEKSPKQYRFTFTSRLQNLALDIIQNLYRANDTFITDEVNRTEKMEQRLAFQHQALTDLRLLAYFAQLALEQKAILPKQYEQIALQSSDCMNLVGAWINSDRKRFAGGGASSC